jgi:hypothetical protein
LSGLTRTDATVAPDVMLSLGEAQQPGQTPRVDDAVRFRTAPESSSPDDNLVVYESGDGFHFRYADATEFFISRDGRTIRGTWAPASTLADTETYLLGPVLGFAQRLMGILCLHASAVVIDDCAVALCGPAYSGKSTTAGAFGAAGFGVLADDMTSIRDREGRAIVMPAYDHLRVWEDSERILLGSSGALPRLTPTWDKRALSLRRQGWTFREQPAMLGAVIFLAPRDEDARAPRIEPVAPGDAFVALAANSYANYLLDDAMRAAEFAGIARLMTSVRVFRTAPSSDPGRIGDLVRTIVGAVLA